MANNTIQLKRTSIPGRVANTTTLPNPGELAINMNDGILYSTNGSVVFEIGSNLSTLTVNSLSYPSTDGSVGEVLKTDGAGNLSCGPVGPVGPVAGPKLRLPAPSVLSTSPTEPSVDG